MFASLEGALAPALLARVPGLSAGHLSELIAAAGGEPARAVEPRVAREVDLPPAARSFLGAPDEEILAADLAWLAQSGAQIVLASDAHYPELLKESSGPPAALYVLGSVAALGSAQLAMVGSRNPTPAGRSTAREFAAWFARAGLTV